MGLTCPPPPLPTFPSHPPPCLAAFPPLSGFFPFAPPPFFPHCPPFASCGPCPLSPPSPPIHQLRGEGGGQAATQPPSPLDPPSQIYRPWGGSSVRAGLG